MTVKNRVSMAPMGTNFGEQNGEMSFLHLDYYEQRAMGGVGLIIVENKMPVWILRRALTVRHSSVSTRIITYRDYSNSVKMCTDTAHALQSS